MQRIDSSEQNPDFFVTVSRLFGVAQDTISMGGKVCVLLG